MRGVEQMLTNHVQWWISTGVHGFNSSQEASGVGIVTITWRDCIHLPMQVEIDDTFVFSLKVRISHPIPIQVFYLKITLWLLITFVVDHEHNPQGTIWLLLNLI